MDTKRNEEYDKNVQWHALPWQEGAESQFSVEKRHQGFQRFPVTLIPMGEQFADR